MRQENGRHEPPGQTTATAQRPAQVLAAPWLSFDLNEELGRLSQEEIWARGDRNGKTLVKEPHLRLTLTLLKAGAWLGQHSTEGPVTIQVIKGRLRVLVDSERVHLSLGQIVALDARVQHDVEALEDSAMLLTIGWPRG